MASFSLYFRHGRTAGQNEKTDRLIWKKRQIHPDQPPDGENLRKYRKIRQKSKIKKMLRDSLSWKFRQLHPKKTTSSNRLPATDWSEKSDAFIWKKRQIQKSWKRSKALFINVLQRILPCCPSIRTTVERSRSACPERTAYTFKKGTPAV